MVKITNGQVYINITCVANKTNLAFLSNILHSRFQRAFQSLEFTTFHTARFIGNENRNNLLTRCFFGLPELKNSRNHTTGILRNSTYIGIVLVETEFSCILLNVSLLDIILKQIHCFCFFCFKISDSIQRIIMAYTKSHKYERTTQISIVLICLTFQYECINFAGLNCTNHLTSGVRNHRNSILEIRKVCSCFHTHRIACIKIAQHGNNKIKTGGIIGRIGIANRNIAVSVCFNNLSDVKLTILTTQFIVLRFL